MQQRVLTRCIGVYFQRSLIDTPLFFLKESDGPYLELTPPGRLEEIALYLRIIAVSMWGREDSLA